MSSASATGWRAVGTCRLFGCRWLAAVIALCLLLSFSASALRLSDLSSAGRSRHTATHSSTLADQARMRTQTTWNEDPQNPYFDNDDVAENEPDEDPNDLTRAVNYDDSAFKLATLDPLGELLDGLTDVAPDLSAACGGAPGGSCDLDSELDAKSALDSLSRLDEWHAPDLHQPKPDNLAPELVLSDQEKAIRARGLASLSASSTSAEASSALKKHHHKARFRAAVAGKAPAKNAGKRATPLAKVVAKPASNAAKPKAAAKVATKKVSAPAATSATPACTNCTATPALVAAWKPVIAKQRAIIKKIREARRLLQLRIKRTPAGPQLKKLQALQRALPLVEHEAQLLLRLKYLSHLAASRSGKSRTKHPRFLYRLMMNLGDRVQVVHSQLLTMDDVEDELCGLLYKGRKSVCRKILPRKKLKQKAKKKKKKRYVWRRKVIKGFKKIRRIIRKKVFRKKKGSKKGTGKATNKKQARIRKLMARARFMLREIDGFKRRYPTTQA